MKKVFNNVFNKARNNKTFKWITGQIEKQQQAKAERVAKRATQKAEKEAREAEKIAKKEEAVAQTVAYKAEVTEINTILEVLEKDTYSGKIKANKSLLKNKTEEELQDLLVKLDPEKNEFLGKYIEKMEKNINLFTPIGLLTGIASFATITIATFATVPILIPVSIVGFGVTACAYYKSSHCFGKLDLMESITNKCDSILDKRQRLKMQDATIEVAIDNGIKKNMAKIGVAFNDQKAPSTRKKPASKATVKDASVAKKSTPNKKQA